MRFFRSPRLTWMMPYWALSFRSISLRRATAAAGNDGNDAFDEGLGVVVVLAARASAPCLAAGGVGRRDAGEDGQGCGHAPEVGVGFALDEAGDLDELPRQPRARARRPPRHRARPCRLYGAPRASIPNNSQDRYAHERDGISLEVAHDAWPVAFRRRTSISDTSAMPAWLPVQRRTSSARRASCPRRQCWSSSPTPAGRTMNRSNIATRCHRLPRATDPKASTRGREGSPTRACCLTGAWNSRSRRFHQKLDRARCKVLSGSGGNEAMPRRCLPPAR